MLIFEPLAARGFMALDPARNVLTFKREVVGKFPAVGKTKLEEFKWLIGEWAAEKQVRATPTTPAYSDTYYYTYRLAEDQSHFAVTGPSGKTHPHLTFDPFSNR